ncbi:MAG: ATP-binding protein [Desulfurococcaceae archaeon]
MPIGFENKIKYPLQDIPIDTASSERFIIIGRVINSIPEYSAKLAESSLYRHVLITGTTGSGKSRTASIIAKRISEELNIRVVILDWHSEYMYLLNRYKVVDPYSNPLQLFTGDPNDISVISSVMELTPPQEYLLEKILRRVNLDKLRSIDALLDYVENYPEESNWMKESKLALHRKLSLLVREKYNLLFKLQSPEPVKKIVSGVSSSEPNVVDLGKIPDINVRKLYAGFFLKRIVDAFIASRTPLVIIIEEAQNYLSRSQAIKPLCEMLREVRKFNIGLIVISQSINQLIEDATLNTNTKIIHSVKSREDLEVVAKALYLEYNILTTLPYIEPGEAVYSTPTIKKPVLIKIE